MTSRVVATTLLLVAALLALAPTAGAAEPPAAVSPPAVIGQPVHDDPVEADPGDWVPDSGLTFTYQWLRGGEEIAGATQQRYRPVLADIGKHLRVRVTATDEAGQTGVATSDPSDEVGKGVLRSTTRPSLSGTKRYTRTLTADPGRWGRNRVEATYRWLRDGEPIRGASSKKYVLSPEDVGRRIRVRVFARKEGYKLAQATSTATRLIMHRVPVSRTATYRIETRGHITASMEVFRAQVAETFADPRGWRSAGVAFQRVAEGGDFSVVLAEAGTVPSFSPVCSAQWSCRVGRYVVINQLRWRNASPSWNDADEPLRGYRHMVVNHETGHWLGHGHLGCSGDGNLAPVMMQQSKGLDGCRHNPWPLPSELWH